MWCLGLGWCFWGDAHAGVSCRLQVGAPSRLRHFLYGRRDATRSQGIVLAKMWCFGLGWCFWGDAHAGVSCRLQVGAPSRLRHFLHGGRDATRSQGIVLAKMWCLGLGWCFWGDAHAGVSCRLQVGAPSRLRHFLYGDRDGRAPRTPSLVVICDLVFSQVQLVARIFRPRCVARIVSKRKSGGIKYNLCASGELRTLRR